MNSGVGYAVTDRRSSTPATAGSRAGISFVQTYEGRGSVTLPGMDRSLDVIVRFRDTIPLRQFLGGSAEDGSATEVSAILTREDEWERVLAREPSLRQSAPAPKLFFKAKPQLALRWKSDGSGTWARSAAFEAEGGRSLGDRKVSAQWNSERPAEVSLLLTSEQKAKHTREVAGLPIKLTGEGRQSSAIRLTLPLRPTGSAARRTALRRSTSGPGLERVVLWLGILLLAAGFLSNGFQYPLPMGIDPAAAVKTGFALSCAALAVRFLRNGVYALGLGLALIVGTLYFGGESASGMYVLAGVLIAYDLFPGLIAYVLFATAAAFAITTAVAELPSTGDRVWHGAIALASFLMAIHLSRKQRRMSQGI